MKKGISLFLVLILCLSALAMPVSASDSVLRTDEAHVVASSYTIVYAPDGRSEYIPTEDLGAWLSVGWYTVPVMNVYAPDGRSMVIAIDQWYSYKNVGWYDYPVTTVYALDGRSMVIATSAVETYKGVGWYPFIPMVMYAPDGRTEVVNKNDAYLWQQVGWYTEPVTILYAADGRAEVVPTRNVNAWLQVGWYTTPQNVTMYAPDGRTATVAKANVYSWQQVGWSTSPFQFSLENVAYNYSNLTDNSLIMHEKDSDGEFYAYWCYSFSYDFERFLNYLDDCGWYEYTSEYDYYDDVYYYVLYHPNLTNGYLGIAYDDWNNTILLMTTDF